ncbi:hypothetical protein [Verrucomicrobium spinosum]|uniref:hypothetical protein n=1 Tax=Verrucomicrobium spinosum TaxID=2736 RepID=UPI0012E27972|nr:hypothetical protein [Verrucomicrobium spinosum]
MVLGLVAVLAVDYVFNLRSTIVFLAFRDSRQPLEVRLGGSGSWKPVSALTVARWIAPGAEGRGQRHHLAHPGAAA